jgi:hypothetical protein
MSIDVDLKQLLKNYHSVILRDSKYQDKLDWCFDNCAGNFRDERLGEQVRWYFNNEKDALLFLITWG